MRKGHQQEVGPVAAVILAAGASRRMGRDKARVRIGGRTFLERILEIYSRHGIPLYVVLGPGGELPLPGQITVLRNPQPERGPLSSLWIALERLEPFTGFFLHPVDHPLVKAETLGSMLGEHQRHPQAIVIPVCQGRRGHPVLFPRHLYPALRQAPLEVGARWVVRSNPERVRLVEVSDEGVLWNLNRPEDVRRAERKKGTAEGTGPPVPREREGEDTHRGPNRKGRKGEPDS